MFSERLKTIREAAGLSQSDLARRSGMSQVAISQYEAAIREPTWAAVQALAAALGVSCDEFTDTPPAQRPKGKRK